MKNTHIIRKQIFEITLPDFNAAMKWEANDRQQIVESVRNEMERCFGEYDNIDNHLIIEKLDLDLGIFTSAKMQSEIPERFYSELRKILSLHWEKSTIGEPSSYDENGKPWDYQPQQRDNTRIYSDTKARLESLFFFLRKGYLPWWASDITEWDKQWLEKLTPNEWKSIKQFLTIHGKTPPVRLATQLSDEFLAALIKGLDVKVNTKDAWNWLSKLITNLSEDEIPWIKKTYGEEYAASITLILRKAPIQLKVLRQRYWSQLILHALGEGSLPNLHDLLDRHRNILTVIKLLSQRMDSYDIHFSSFGEIPTVWKQELEKATEPRTKSENITDVSKVISKSLDVQTEDTKKSSDEFDVRNESFREIKNLTDEIEEIIIATEAGLVLLHPFLQELFCNCGWMDKQEFSNAYAQTQAVYALYYLATGKIEVPEHQLLLPKLLCGIHWEVPLEPVAPLWDTEKSACEELLTAVIKHWNALGNTSPDGLRETFLQRTGKLEMLPGEWRLQIEYETQDILLNRIPWGISKIKLPWMKSLLSVTWDRN